MSNFESYGQIALGTHLRTEYNGRYGNQAEAERLIVRDVIAKLRIDPTDTLLDIGCGMGTTLVPLSMMVAESVGIDHPNVVAKLGSQFPGAPFKLIGGDFLEVKLERKFSCIVAYSVLNSMSSREALFRFVDKALGLLSDDGRLLFSDLPNADKKRRFLESERGRAFDRAWKAQMAASTQVPSTPISSVPAGPMLVYDDALVTEMVLHIRRKGLHAYLLDQPQNLPFGNSREDVLVVAPSCPRY